MRNNVIRVVVALILGLTLLVPMVAIPSSIVQAAGPAISVGDRVAVTEYGDGVAVRSSYSTGSSLIRTMPAGYEGKVIAGPQYNEGYTWWYIQWVTGHYGWTADAYPGGVIYLQPLPGNGIYPSVTNSGLSYRVCVYVDAGNLAVRTGPGTGYTLVTRKSVGSRGWTTALGPYVSTSEQLVWWHVQWDDGTEGWSADSRSDIEVGVYLIKEGSRYLPTIARGPSSFSFSATQGGSNPSSQTLSIWNSGGGTLSWSVSDSASWLTLSPTSGSSTGETDSVTLSVSISGLSAGSYSGTITISASGATNTPQTVPVSLTMNPQSSCWSTDPLSNAELADLVVAHFPDGTVPQTGDNIRVTAYAIARAESGGNPTACGDAGQSIGIWQVNMPYHPEYSIECLFDPDCNAEAALEISNNGLDWNPWCTWEESACGGDGNEAYKAYLDEAKFALGISPTPTTPQKTDTGFFYPTGEAGPYRYAGWLARGDRDEDNDGYNDYDEGLYHLGVDMEADVGDIVYAIADGEIVYVSVNGWGEGNYGLLVRHKLNTGESFLALYGHVRPIREDLRFAASGPVNPSVSVTGGQEFATVGPYGSVPHVHFGIHPGTQIPSSPWGRMPLDNWCNTNGFVDPLDWITAKTWDIVKIGSPGELRVYDSQERVTGLVNGEVRMEIPNSSYSDETVIISSPSDSYHYKVVGTGEGSYALTVTQVREQTSEFTVTNMATSSGAVHEYTIDWNALSQGEDGVTVYIDSDGDGVIDKILRMGGSFNPGCFIATAAYGTPMADEVQTLREFRDEYLLTNPVGRAFVGFYYEISPPIAKFVAEHPVLKPIVRAGLVPAVVMSTIAVNTTPAEKVATLAFLALVSAATALWVVRRRGKHLRRT
jgi:hypothetical protein